MKCTPEAVKKSKACQYIRDGQTYTPDRYLGWVQFGMWLLRPRVVREFRGSTTPLENRQNVEIAVPEFSRITIDVPRAGAFYLIESNNTVTHITAWPTAM